MAARSHTSRPSSSPYPSGGAGGKLRSSRRSSSRSSTPYDRPSSLLPPPPPPSDFLPLPSASSPSIKSRFVHTASRLLSSSASFFFSSFLGRKSIRISAEGGNNEPSAVAEDGDEGVATVETSTEEQHSVQDSDEETACSLENAEPPTPQLRNDSFVGGEGAGTLVEEVGGQSSGHQEKELDLVQVEGMLKTKTLSREQVDRLTGILQTRVVESDITRPHSTGKPVNSLKKDAFVRPEEEDAEEEEEEGADLAPITEAQRWREELRRARTDLTPIELARAYMGEKTAMPARWRSLSLRGVDRQISRVPEVQPYRGLLGDNSWASPIPRSSVHTAIRPAKPAPVVDEGWMSVGPVRRARQRVFRTISHSPYARGLVSKENTMPRANVSTPMQSSHTAQKILDTLEKLSPSPKGRLFDGDINSAGERTPIGLNTDRYNSGRYVQEFSRFSNTRAAPSNGRLDFESMVQTPTRLLSQEFDATKQELTAHEKVPSKRVAALHGLDAKPPPNAVEVPSFSSTAATVRPSPVANANPFSIAVGSAAASLSQGAKEDSLETVKKPFFPPVPSSMASAVSSSLGLFGTSTSISMMQPYGKPSVPAFSTAFALPVTERFEDSKERNEPPGVSETAAAGQTFKSGDQSDASATGPVSFSKIGQSTATALFGLAASSSAKTSSSFPSSFSSHSFSSHGTSSNTLPPQGISTNGTPLTSSPPASQNTSSKTLPPLGISTNTSFTFSPPAFPLVSCSTPTFSIGGNNGVPNFGSTLAGSPFGSKIAPAFGSNVAIPGFGTATTSLSSSMNISESLSGTCSASTSDAIVISSEAVSTSVPVFSFRSPSGGLKVPDIGSSGALLPEPTFTFGCGTSPSVSATSTQLPAGKLSFSGPQVGFGLLDSTTGSGSAVLPTLKVVTSPPQAPFELSGGFASGPAGSQKSGRKFVKAKRRK